VTGRRAADGRPTDEAPAPDHRRLFVAVPLPPSSIRAVEGLLDGVREAGAARWVRIESLHVTLRFLGQTHADRIPGILAAMAATASGERPFPVRIAGAGSFPNRTRPRTLWLGIDDGGRLAGLAGQLDAALAEFDWEPEDRPFRGHLTVARTDGMPSGGDVAARLMADADAFETAFEADRIVLFASHLGRGAARYEPLEEVRFG
jgi:2'-5' RNA ligase